MIRGDWVGMYYDHSVCMYYDHSQRQQTCKRTRCNMTNFMPKRSNRKLDPSPLWLFMNDSYPSILKMTWLTSSTISMSMFTSSVLTDVQQDKVEHERNHDKKLLIACLISCLCDWSIPYALTLFWHNLCSCVNVYIWVRAETSRKYLQTEADSVTYDMGGRVGL